LPRSYPIGPRGVVEAARIWVRNVVHAVDPAS
jgi:hypothetical protein